MTVVALHFGDRVKGFETWAEAAEWLEQIEFMLNILNPMLDLRHVSGNILTVGISESMGTMDFSRESYYAAYFTTLGDRSLSAEGEQQTFNLSDGQQAEIPLRNCIPLPRLMAAVQEFFETGERPTSVDWEEV